MITRGMKVLHPNYDGVWKVFSLHSKPGWVWCEPVDDTARAIALWLNHGMLGAQRNRLTPYKEHDHGILGR